MATNTIRRLRPSDCVIWDWSKDGRTLRLKRLNPDGVPFVDRTPDAGNPRGRWTATLRYEGSDPFGHLDLDGRGWTLTTVGGHRGGTRHRPYLTFVEGQNKALAWLDRRFALAEEM